MSKTVNPFIKQAWNKNAIEAAILKPRPRTRFNSQPQGATKFPRSDMQRSPVTFQSPLAAATGFATGIEQISFLLRKWLAKAFLTVRVARLQNEIAPPPPPRKIQASKNSININFSVRISCGHSWPLRLDAPGSKSFSPPSGPQENPLFGADVFFSVRTSMTRRVVEKLCTKVVCVDFLAPKKQLIWYEEWLEKRVKRIRKRIRDVSKHV